MSTHKPCADENCAASCHSNCTMECCENNNCNMELGEELTPALRAKSECACNNDPCDPS